MNNIKRTIYLIILAITGTTEAVNINQKGMGEVLIYPYYTVNENYNTFYTVVNTTADAKAIKVKFLEGENSREVLSFNVYLGAYDMWVGNLSPVTSTISGHAGEPTARHTTADNSCSPFLNKTGQEFLPYLLEQDSPNNSLQRSTEGHIVILEMGTLTGSSAAAVDPGTTGVPANCDQLTIAWTSSGYWDLDTTVDMLEPTGGLSGTGTLIDIMEGSAIGYDAIALDEFWQGAALHTEPGSPMTNLANAYPESKILNDGVITTSTWQTGVEAVSAVLMQHKIYNEYDFTGFLAASSEWVITYPTKFFHVNDTQLIPPFTDIWDTEMACEENSLQLWDREEINDPSVDFPTCYSVNVLEFLRPGSTPGTSTQMLGSNNNISVIGIDDATEAGWATIRLDVGGQNMMDSSQVKYSGLPAVGFMVQRYINAGAPAGVLAIYSGLFPHKTEPKNGIVVDLIFADSFETP